MASVFRIVFSSTPFLLASEVPKCMLFLLTEAFIMSESRALSAREGYEGSKARQEARKQNSETRMSQKGGSSSATSDVSSVVDSLRNLPLAERLWVVRSDFSRELSTTETLQNPHTITSTTTSPLTRSRALSAGERNAFKYLAVVFIEPQSV